MGQNCTLGARALTLGDLSSAVGLVLGNFLGHQRRCCLPNSTRVDRCRYLRRDSRSLPSKFDFLEQAESTVEATLATRGKRRQVKKMSKSPKVKPPIFIGSSSEGYEIAKAVTALLRPQTQPTLWKKNVFLPGSFILERLETLTTDHYFAVFVASPDDDLTSRGQKYPAMRDNVLFECGMFMGAHGRKHALLICPDTPRIKLASDLGGIITATYNAGKITKNPKVAVRSACQEVLKTIMNEWARMERQKARKLLALERAKEVKAAKKLNGLILRWLDATNSDFFEGFSNPTGFNKMKAKIAKGVRKLAKLCAAEARLTGLEQHLEALTEATDAALGDFPIPRGMGKDRVSNSFNKALKRENRRYRSWWRNHRPRLHKLATEMGRAVSNVAFRVLAQSTTSNGVAWRRGGSARKAN